MANKAYYLFH